MKRARPDGQLAGAGGDPPPVRRRPAAAYDPADPPDLVVVVAQGCRSSERSLRELAMIAAMRPHARTAVLDVAGPHPLPVSLIGTPTWVWRGRARWWGTPAVREVLAVLDAEAPDPPAHGQHDGGPDGPRSGSDGEGTG